jgi:kynurenine 3-monooxygenase
LLTNSIKRSINLALSARGEYALERAGVFDIVKKQLVPMACRAIHVPGKPVMMQPYGTKDQAIQSVSRGMLNELMLEELGRVCASTGR